MPTFLLACDPLGVMSDSDGLTDSALMPIEEEDTIQHLHGDENLFIVGEKFSTYDEFKKKVDAYERFHIVQLYRSDSRTLEAAKKRVPRKVNKAKTELNYYQINLSCVFGGRKYCNKGSGKDLAKGEPNLMPFRNVFIGVVTVAHI